MPIEILLEKKKLLLMSNIFFPSVFNRLKQQTHKTRSLFGNGLTVLLNKQIMPALLGLKNNLISNLSIFKTSKAYEKEKDHTTFVEFVIDNLP